MEQEVDVRFSRALINLIWISNAPYFPGDRDFPKALLNTLSDLALIALDLIGCVRW